HTRPRGAVERGATPAPPSHRTLPPARPIFQPGRSARETCAACASCALGAEAVPVRHLLRGTPASDDETSAWTPHRHERDDLVALGDATERAHLVLVDAIDGRERGADAEAACREHEALHRGIDRRKRRP